MHWLTYGGMKGISGLCEDLKKRGEESGDFYEIPEKGKPGNETEVLIFVI